MSAAFRHRIMFAGTLVLVVLLLGLGAWIVDRNDTDLDLSYGNRRTLAPQTVRVLELIDRPITLRAFYADVPNERQVLFDLVKRYQRHTRHLDLEFVDLDRRPELARLHGVTLNRTVVLSTGELQVRTVGPGEAELTGALVRLLVDEPPKLAFLIGHGQASIEDATAAGLSQLAELIQRQNFEVSIFSLAGADRIPPDIDVLVNPAPERPMSETERQSIHDFLRRGGRLLAMVEPLGAADFDSLLTVYGLTPDPGFLVDPTEARRNMTGPGSFRIVLGLRADPNHPITHDFTYPTLYPLARSIHSVQPPPPGVTVTRLVDSAVECWAETDLTQMVEGTPEFDEGIDAAGPLGLAYAASVSLRRFTWGNPGDVGLTSSMLDLQTDVDLRDPTAADTLSVGDLTVPEALPEEARIVVVGDVDFAGNANLQVRGNGDLLLAMVLWLAEQENRIALAPRPDASDPVVLTQNQKLWIRVAGIGVAPAACLFMSLVILWRRSRWL